MFDGEYGGLALMGVVVGFFLIRGFIKAYFQGKKEEFDSQAKHIITLFGTLSKEKQAKVFEDFFEDFHNAKGMSNFKSVDHSKTNYKLSIQNLLPNANQNVIDNLRQNIRNNMTRRSV